MKSTTPADQPYLDAIRSTYVDLERWKTRAVNTEPPQRGSELAVDDKIFPRHPISELARMSLRSSGEHLRLARDVIETGHLYPSAHFTVLRGALVGAAQAVWVLGPDDHHTRQERGLTVLTEMHKQMSKHYRRLELHELSREERTDLTDQQAWLQTRMDNVDAVRTSKAALNLTDDVIPAALDLVYADPDRRQDGRLLWALMSGDAHVLGWSTATRGRAGKPDRTSGLAEHAVGGSFGDVAQPFMASYGLLRAGWSLFDRRAEGP